MEGPPETVSGKSEKLSTEKLKEALTAYDPDISWDEEVLEAIAGNEVLLKEILEKPQLIEFIGEYHADSDFFKLDKGQLDQHLYDLHLRLEAYDQIDRDINNRLKKDPFATESEMRAGVYFEQLEPQVREVVFNLSDKGWVTFESGFDDIGFGHQYIGFAKEPSLESYKVPEDLTARLKERGIEIEINLDEEDRDTIRLIPSRKLSLDEWRQVWNDIGESFPTASHKEDLSNKIQGANIFRLKQEKLKRGEDTYITKNFFQKGGEIVEEK